MQAEARQKRISDYLHKVEFASLEELSTQVEASVSTVRRDLAALEGTGQIRRTHGGARLINPASDEFTFSFRDTRQLSEKEAIGKACAELIKPNETVILDAGTTTYHVACHLEPENATNHHQLASDCEPLCGRESRRVGGIRRRDLSASWCLSRSPCRRSVFQNPRRRRHHERGWNHFGRHHQLSWPAHRNPTCDDPRRATRHLLFRQLKNRSQIRFVFVRHRLHRHNCH